MAIATSRPAIAFSTWSRPFPTTTTRRSAPSASTRSSRWSSSGRLAIGWRTLCVSERIRVPCPAARITTAKRRLSLIAASNGMALRRAPVRDKPYRPGKRKGRPERAAQSDLNSERLLKDVLVIFVSDEAHLLDVGLLGYCQHLVDQLVAGGGIRLQVQLGDWVHLLGHLKIGAQLIHGDGVAVPGDRVRCRDADRVLQRLDRRRRLVGVLRQVQLHRVRLDRQRDDEHDEENQHDVDQRRRVDVHHRFAGGIVASCLHRHGGLLLAYCSVAAAPPGGSEMNPTRWKPASCIVRIVAPMHLYCVLTSP